MRSLSPRGLGGSRALLFGAALSLALGGALGACAPSGGKAAADKPLVVATIFPDYDFVRALAGDRVELKLFLPPGVEAHAYEPSPSDLAAVAKAALFVYTSRAMEPWAADIAAAAGGKELLVLESAQGIELSAEADHGEGEAERGAHEGPDPHVWLDPRLAVRMVDNLARGLAEVDPAGAAVYAENAEAYKRKLLELDARIERELSGAARRTIVYGGHFAFGYFARRYGLEYSSPYAGFSPDAEPSPRAVAELVATLKATGAPVVFHEELLEPRVARVLAAETGARLELLHGAHNLSREELASGATYLSLMEDNLRKLKLALGAP